MHKNYEVDKTLVRHLKTSKLLFKSFRNERICKTGCKFGLPVATISLEIIQKYVTEQWMIKSNMKCKVAQITYVILGNIQSYLYEYRQTRFLLFYVITSAFQMP